MKHENSSFSLPVDNIASRIQQFVDSQSTEFFPEAVPEPDVHEFLFCNLEVQHLRV